MGNYFFTTFINGFTKLAPYIAFLLGGYFIFIKLPFLFLKKSMDHQKKKLNEDSKDLKIVEEKYTVEDYMAFKQKMQNIDYKKEEPKREERRKEERKNTEQKKEEPKKERAKTEQRSEQRKEAPKRPAPARPKEMSPEEVLHFKPNEPFTQAELKKRYFDLLKQNHPDRVASMGEDFKSLAEKNTKELNKAYEILKKKAA